MGRPDSYRCPLLLALRRLLPPLAVHPAPCLPAPTPTASARARARARAGVAVPKVLPLIERAISEGDVRRLGPAVHAVLVKTALTHHTLLSSRLVKLYATLPSPDASRAVFEDLPYRNAHSYNYLLAALGRGPATLPDALQVLDEMPASSRNAISYNTVISALVWHGRPGEAIRVFARLARDRFLGPEVALDRSAVVSVATACARMGAGRPLRELHGVVVLSGMKVTVIMATTLLDAYSKAGRTEDARMLFNQMSIRNRVSWSSMISGYCRAKRLDGSRTRVHGVMPEQDTSAWTALISGHKQNGEEHAALELFEQMVSEGMTPTSVTLVSSLSACAKLGLVKRGKEVHGFILRHCIGSDPFNIFIHNALIDMYSNCGDTAKARVVFERMPERNNYSYNYLLAALSRGPATLPDALHLLDVMPASCRDTVSYNTVMCALAGHGQQGEEHAALEFFEQMLSEGMVPTSFSLVSSLIACAKLGLMKRGKEVHGFILRHCIGSNPFNIFIHNALINLYSKCGDMATAMVLFDRMPERDMISWDSMVTGFSRNGQGKQSLGMFNRMLEAEVQPTSVTYLAVLAACSHAGLVSDGCRILESMQHHGVEPRAEHYASFVDALGRNNQLEEASEFIKGLSSRKGPGTVWSLSVLLGACRVHRNMEMAEKVVETLCQLEPENSDWYVILSNMYAAAGQWDDARRVWTLMKEKGLSKNQACSWIEVRTAKHMVIADDMSHCEANEIRDIGQTTSA